MDLPHLKDQFITAAREYYAATEAMLETTADNQDSSDICDRASRAQVAMESAMHELDTAIKNDRNNTK